MVGQYERICFLSRAPIPFYLTSAKTSPPGKASCSHNVGEGGGEVEIGKRVGRRER